MIRKRCSKTDPDCVPLVFNGLKVSNELNPDGFNYLETTIWWILTGKDPNLRPSEKCMTTFRATKITAHQIGSLGCYLFTRD